MYIKLLHKLSWIRIHKNLIPQKLTTILCSSNSYTTINTNISYNWPAFLAASWLNSGYTSSYTLIRMCY